MSNKYRKVVIKKQVALLKKATQLHGGQTSLAKLLGVSRQQVNNYSNGKNEIRWSMYMKILELVEDN